MVPDLVKISELLLVPSSFLVAALGTADTNLHRAAVSLLGLVVSVLWLVCAREALVEVGMTKPEIIRTARMRILAWFPMAFVTGRFFFVNYPPDVGGAGSRPRLIYIFANTLTDAALNEG